MRLLLFRLFSVLDPGFESLQVVQLFTHQIVRTIIRYLNFINFGRVNIF